MVNVGRFVLRASSRLSSSSSIVRPQSTQAASESAKRPVYTKLSDGTAEEFKFGQIAFAKVGSPEAVADRMLKMVSDMRGLDIGATVDLYEHSVQTATRALLDGAAEEKVVCALLHDVGEFLVPACHGEVAGSMLRPYISPENYWILNHHEIFQFCGRWDEVAFDPNFENAPLSEFRPMVIRLLQRSPFSMAGQASCATSRAKADLGAYDFDDWMAKNHDKKIPN